MPSVVNETYTFGEYRLELASRSLSRSGSAIPLPPKTFDLLALLVQRAGTVVSKRDILAELWPDTFVEEANLSFQVATLRKVLGANTSLWIETVPKHGYRFKACVERIATTNPLHAAPDASGERSPIRAQSLPVVTSDIKTGTLRRLLVIAAVVIAMSLAAWFIIRRIDKSPSRSLIALPVVTYPGVQRHPSLSPDGSQVAFTWDGPNHNNCDIYVKVVGEEPPLRLTSDPRPEYSPAWSPDGQYIAFFRGTGAAVGEIVVIPALGGTERVVARPSADWVPADYLEAQALSWFPDGTALAVVGYVRQTRPRSVSLSSEAAKAPSAHPGPAAIYGLSLATGRYWPLTSPGSPGFGDGLPAISPDGHKLAFARTHKVDFDEPDLFAVALTLDKAASGEPILLARDRVPETADRPREDIAGLAWLPDSSSMVFTQGGGLWLTALHGHPPKLLALTGVQPIRLSISRSGSRLVFENISGHLDIVRVPGPAYRETSGQSGPPRPFISSTELDSNPQYSPDGTRIAFTSSRTGVLQIWVCRSDGSNPTQLTQFTTDTGTPRWSPDGHYIAFDSDQAGAGDIYIVPADGGPARRFTSESSNEYVPSWSRDGHWIYYASDRSGESQLWKAPFPSGAPVQVTKDGGMTAFESSDRKFVYYAKRYRNGIWRQPIGGGPEEFVVNHGHPYFWDMYDHGLCLLSAASHPPTVECLDFSTGALRTTAVLPDDHGIAPSGPSFAVSPDGQWILYSHLEQTGSLMSISNLHQVPGW